MKDWEDKLDELLDLASRLSGWEIEFLESLDKMRGRDELTEKQDAKLEQIYDRLYG